MTNQISFTPSVTVHLCCLLVLKVSVGQSTSLMDLNGFYGALQDSNGVACLMGIVLSGPPGPCVGP